MLVWNNLVKRELFDGFQSWKFCPKTFSVVLAVPGTGRRVFSFWLAVRGLGSVLPMFQWKASLLLSICLLQISSHFWSRSVTIIFGATEAFSERPRHFRSDRGNFNDKLHCFSQFVCCKFPITLKSFGNRFFGMSESFSKWPRHFRNDRGTFGMTKNVFGNIIAFVVKKRDREKFFENAPPPRGPKTRIVGLAEGWPRAGKGILIGGLIVEVPQSFGMLLANK